MDVRHWNMEKDGPLTERALRERLEALGYAVTRYDYPPGTNFPEHAHGADKIDAVLAGRFEIVLEGEPLVLETGDWAEVPRGALHSARVLGSEAVISLDAVRRR